MRNCSRLVAPARQLRCRKTPRLRAERWVTITRDCFRSVRGFKRCAAELQAEAELIGCALTRLGQDEREQPRVLLAPFPRERDFVKTFGPKYGNACLPRWSRAGA